MSITCEKQFTITVASGLPDPWAYYKVDSWDGTNIVDSVQGLDLVRSSGTTASIAGKIGNALQQGTMLAARNNVDVDFAGVDFTVRGWFQAPGVMQNNNLVVCSDGANVFWDLRTDTTIGGFRWRVRNGVTGIVEIPSITQNVWHHVIAWHRTGVEIGIVMDNGTPVTTAFVPGLSATNLLQMRVATHFDEISIWRGQVLTTAERNADWNDGNGVTYPF